ncbi:MAG: hypothetical protein WC889_05230 [Myxococcota bacterium]|jgi:hypothetical protein
MSLKEYQELISRASGMSSSELLKFISDLAAMAARKKTKGHKHSILELEGLGKSVWDGVDAQEYVDRERSAWNG